MSTSIQPIQLRSLVSLRKLFVDALSTDFGYFPANYHSEVLAQNRLHHFALALARPDRILLGAYRSRNLVGYSISDCSGHTAFLFWIYMIPELRGQGLGKQLLRATEQACRNKGKDNMQLVTHDHRDYYQKNGFGWVDTVTESDNNITMHLMEKQLHV